MPVYRLRKAGCANILTAKLRGGDMAIRKMRVLPDVVLRAKAKKVPIIDKSIHKLIDDMMETMEDSNGAGLAAPQIGVSLRVITLQLSEKENIAIINPEIVKSSNSKTVVEGCLSVPGYQGEIERYNSVTVKGLDRDGSKIRIKAEGIIAQALQHEIDHLNGILYIDHIEGGEEAVQE